ncbi:lysophospholipid acyltransferase family protein [Leptolyngbya sp. FACHB-711]|uniref:1-acyl-sn-glycerol-3-phosphate acyltransferase n=1 Tax=unclassified Leptolyngbya TaxID=2650499 RepID=UPI0016847401|nr:1-acyl-sn-glycerol-3-phosphate acyltransferase [Cyanobacteria bacterium FACHB-502]MBD2027259.1 1-acyl-sn-glycerol-3-phosphate acyltransferase [Leptolyngbya sp. FACHB-711]
MMFNNPLLISQQLLNMLGTRVFFYHRDRVPQNSAVLVVSNHRSFLDAPLLMATLDRSVRFACHHYMGQVPLMREFVTRLGCFPLDAPDHRQQGFFHQAIQLLQSQQAIGIFPEGTEPMVQHTDPHQVGNFQRGFAHLALRAPIQDLAILPVAIASQDETNNVAVPLKLLSWFDPSEPLFDQPGWHPMVIYQKVDVIVGRPMWVTPAQRESYQGKQAKTVVADLTQYCREEIDRLLH